jgi:hypothetical protein
LAKIGVLATLEAKAKFLIMATLKAAAGYDHDAFVALERQQLAQLVVKLRDASSSLDQELLSLVERFDQVRMESHEIRHKFVHALWASSTDTDGAVGRDIRRAESLAPKDLDEAMVKVADLAKSAHDCATRAAHLIVEGRLPEGAEAKPAMYVRGRWVNF